MKTTINVAKETVRNGIMVAFRITLSPHEWDWTQIEQQEMAHTILFLYSKLEEIREKANVEAVE